jgi:hypothetical protein
MKHRCIDKRRWATRLALAFVLACLAVAAIEGYRPTAVILLPEGAAFESAAYFKAPERRKIAEP